MTFLEHCERTFDNRERKRLFRWYQELGEEPQFQLIRRNLDRECDRRDIDERVWNEFLLEIANRLAPHDQIQAEAYRLWVSGGGFDGRDWDDWLAAERVVLSRTLLAPLAPVDSAIRNSPGKFLLAGREVPPPAAGRLARYMRFEDFAINNIQKKFPIPVEGRSHGVSMIRRGTITGKHMEGTSFGKPGNPVWCTDAAMATEEDVHVVRNSE